MKLLVDTHVLLWAVSQESKLSQQAYEAIAHVDNVVFISIATLWELKIKESLGKVELPKNFFKSLRVAGFEILSITIDHIERLSHLPQHHRDPFDRMLVAQAQCEQLILATRDDEIKKYKVNLLNA